MKKAQKTDMVADLSSRFNRASMALVSEYKGMTAAESAELRRRLKAVRGELRVAKNTLVRRAIQETNYAGLDSQLGGPVGVIFSFEDPIAVAKTVTSFKEAGEKFKLRGGVLEGKPLSREEIQDLANMPPKEVVMGQLLGVIAGPGQRLGAPAQRAGVGPGAGDRRDWQEEWRGRFLRARRLRGCRS